MHPYLLQHDFPTSCHLIDDNWRHNRSAINLTAAAHLERPDGTVRLTMLLTADAGSESDPRAGKCHRLDDTRTRAEHAGLPIFIWQCFYQQQVPTRCHLIDDNVPEPKRGHPNRGRPVGMTKTRL